jgi:hypothetical protein
MPFPFPSHQIVVVVNPSLSPHLPKRTDVIQGAKDAIAWMATDRFTSHTHVA